MTPEYIDRYYIESVIDDKILSVMLDVLQIKNPPVSIAHNQLQIVKILEKKYHQENLQKVMKDRYQEVI